MSKYVPGQRWYYRTREEDVGSTVVIGEVEEHTDQSTVVHVLVDGLNAMNPGGPTTIGHMPFTEPALDDSVLKVAETSVEIPNSFQEGVATWRSSGGGVFEVSVADAVAAVISTSMDKSNFFICSCFCCFLLMFPYIFLYGVLHGHPPVLLLKVRPYLPLRLERKEFLP